MRVGLPVAVMSTAMQLASCAAPGTHSPASSTTGTILVRVGQVTDVRERVEGSKPPHGADITVRFENGDVRTYGVESTDSLQFGDKVTVTTAKGVTRITRC